MRKRGKKVDEDTFNLIKSLTNRYGNVKSISSLTGYSDSTIRSIRRLDSYDDLVLKREDAKREYMNRVIDDYSIIDEHDFSDDDVASDAKTIIDPISGYSEEELAEIRSSRATRGRKGCRMHRINMAFTDDVHEYIRAMARVRGETITEFTQAVFELSMKANADLYDQAKAFISEVI